MKVNIDRIPGMGVRFFGFLRKKGWGLITAEELPLLAELFDSDKMKQHGRILANTHELGQTSAG